MRCPDGPRCRRAPRPAPAPGPDRLRRSRARRTSRRARDRAHGAQPAGSLSVFASPARRVWARGELRAERPRSVEPARGHPREARSTTAARRARQDNSHAATVPRLKPDPMSRRADTFIESGRGWRQGRSAKLAKASSKRPNEWKLWLRPVSTNTLHTVALGRIRASRAPRAAVSPRP
jgi:hypothetical protein